MAKDFVTTVESASKISTGVPTDGSTCREDCIETAITAPKAMAIKDNKEPIRADGYVCAFLFSHGFPYRKVDTQNNSCNPCKSRNSNKRQFIRSLQDTHVRESGIEQRREW